jgi:hypothetical protein
MPTVINVKRKATQLEAMQYDGSPESIAELKEWCTHDIFENPLMVSTGVGNYVISPGDYVVAENGDYTKVSSTEFADQFDVV